MFETHSSKAFYVSLQQEPSTILHSTLLNGTMSCYIGR